ncbi:gustatory receptor 95 [Tribolium castaneum]|uniref:Gustatory receptor n=1 Tax=Tribolium castaneum TaxID=7070 RepID=D6X4M1_TRICA|nr:gustatory receptor 95 [Tribolium castaneum]
MAPKSQYVLYSLCKFLTIIPFRPTTPLASTSHKIYCSFVVLTSTVLTIVTFLNNKWYSQFHHIKMSVLILIQLNLSTFNLITTLSGVLWKREKWHKLLNDLNTMTNRNGQSGRSATIATTSIIVSAVILVWIMYFWANYFGVVYYLKKYNVAYFHFFLMFAYSTVLSWILSIILVEYSNLNRTVCKELQLGQSIEQMFCFLKDTVDTFNDIFGWPMALIISFTTLYLVNNLDYMFLATASLPGSIFYRLLADAAMVLLIFTSTVFLIFMCDSVVQEAEKLQASVQKIRRIRPNLTAKEDQDLEKLCGVIIENFPQFSVARFFNIGRGTVLNILSTVTTFFIIMIQLDTKNN